MNIEKMPRSTQAEALLEARRRLLRARLHAPQESALAFGGASVLAVQLLESHGVDTPRARSMVAAAATDCHASGKRADSYLAAASNLAAAANECHLLVGRDGANTIEIILAIAKFGGAALHALATLGGEL